jgi:hypothetical protein
MSKNSEFKRSMARLGIISVMLTVGLFVFAIAPRKVTIPVNTSTGSSDAGIKLMNGGTSTVNYNLKCYNESGTQTFAKSNLFLGPKAQTNHVTGKHCASYTSYYTNLGNGMVVCDYAYYSNRSSSCVNGYTVCSMSQFQANYPGTSPYGYSNWSGSAWVELSGTGLDTSGNSGSWGISYSSGSTWSSNTSNFVGIATSNSSNRCNTSPTGGGATFNNCGEGALYNTYGVFCCPGPNAEALSASCQVEVDATSAADAYLQSPQFKGGAPF